MAQKLTPQQLIFISEYLQDFCGSRAARAAGYSEKTAPQIASRLLKTVHVKAEIERRTKGAMKKVEAAADAVIEAHAVTAENIIAALAKMGLAHQVMAKFLKVTPGGDLDYDFTGATPEDLQAIAPMIQEIKTERYAEGRGENAREVIRTSVKLVERKGVLELLGKWEKLKLWTDRVQVDPVLDGIFSEMTEDELLEYSTSGLLPIRFRGRIAIDKEDKWPKRLM